MEYAASINEKNNLDNMLILIWYIPDKFGTIKKIRQKRKKIMYVNKYK